MYVYVCFDVEDLVHPDSDDIPRDIADMLADDGIVASMCVVGEKARLWERRGRHDVIAAVGKHDVSLHTNYHSVHPTVSEYLADKDWEAGVAEAVRREGPGVRDLARIFGAYPSSWGTGGYSWGPQIPAATRLLGVPSNIYTQVSLEVAGAWWFAGQLCYPEGVALPGCEDACCDDASFEAGLPVLLEQVDALQRDGTSCLLLFGGHPTRFRYTEFWDTINYNRGQNTDPADYRFAPRRSDEAYTTGLRNLRRMLMAVRDLPGVEMTSTRTLNRRFALESESVAWADLRRLARAIADSEAIRNDDPLASPAQALDALCRAILRLVEGDGTPPTHLPLRLVLGPVQIPPALNRPVQVGLREAVNLCKQLVHQVDAARHLPASLTVDGTEVGPGPLLRAAAVVLLDMDRGAESTKMALQPGAEEPAIAARLAQEKIHQLLHEWSPHDPQLELDRLALHTRLQSWSLKPAALAD
jgi:hypothetical protein